MPPFSTFQHKTAPGICLHHWLCRRSSGGKWQRRTHQEAFAHSYAHPRAPSVSVGLLSAYDLSKDRLFLDLAKQLGDKVSARTSGEGVTPYTFSGGYGGMGCPSLAESGTMQVRARRRGGGGGGG